MFGCCGGFMMLGGLLFTCLIVALIIGAGVLIFALLRREPGILAARFALLAPTPSPNLLETLKQRYAKGEINQEQFDEMKRELGV